MRQQTERSQELAAENRDLMATLEEQKRAYEAKLAELQSDFDHRLQEQVRSALLFVARSPTPAHRQRGVADRA